MTIRELRCKRESCFYRWTPRTDNPKWCPKCHYSEWEEISPLKLKLEGMLNKTYVPTIKRRYKKRMGYKMPLPEEIMARCFKCRNKRLLKNIKHVTLKNGRRAVWGICESCGTKVYTIVKSNTLRSKSETTFNKKSDMQWPKTINYQATYHPKSNVNVDEWINAHRKK